jgi:hypothetical protein
VYTAKAMAGLIDLIRRRRFGRDEHVIFVHSGGGLWDGTCPAEPGEAWLHAPAQGLDRINDPPTRDARRGAWQAR